MWSHGGVTAKPFPTLLAVWRRAAARNRHVPRCDDAWSRLGRVEGNLSPFVALKKGFVAGGDGRSQPQWEAVVERRWGINSWQPGQAEKYGGRTCISGAC